MDRCIINLMWLALVVFAAAILAGCNSPPNSVASAGEDQTEGSIRQTESTHPSANQSSTWLTPRRLPAARLPANTLNEASATDVKNTVVGNTVAEDQEQRKPVFGGRTSSAAKLLSLQTDDNGHDSAADNPIRQVALPVVRPLPPAAEEAPPQAIQTLDRRAAEHVRQGFILGQRGATFSARVQFIKALRIIAQGLDAATGTTDHTAALAAGMQALEEAADFVPQGSGLHSEIDVAHTVSLHRTPLLRSLLPFQSGVTKQEHVSPLVASQKYLTFAAEKLARATGNVSSGSGALYGLGRLRALEIEGSGGDELATPQAATYYQAALLADFQNYLAANELAVLVGRCGDWPAAKQILVAAIAVKGEPEMWKNLATVHRKLAEPDLAALAQREYATALRRDRLSQQNPGTSEMVRWVAPNAFTQAGQGGTAVGVPAYPPGQVPRHAGQAPVARQSSPSPYGHPAPNQQTQERAASTSFWNWLFRG